MHGAEGSQDNYHGGYPESGRLSFDLEKQASPADRKRLMNKALQYEFKLNDLNKYSSKLKYKDMEWKFTRSAMGKIVPNDEARRKRLEKNSFLNKLYKLLKHTDWARTPIYHQFQRNGRWKHEDENIYAELEVKYLLSALQSMCNDKSNEEEFEASEGKSIIAKHADKTFHTLEVLMN